VWTHASGLIPVWYDYCMKSLREVIKDAKEKGVAVAHFNVSDSTQLHGVVEVATELALPVIIGVSEGEAKFIGRRFVAAMVKEYQRQGKPVYLNADHTHDLAGIQESIDAGFDAVIIDAAKLPLEENIKLTRDAVALARNSGRDVLVEAELGFIGEGSKIIEAAPVGLEKTNPEVAARFVRETGIDLFAPAVGNIHGVIAGGVNPHIDIPLLKAVVAACDVSLVLHGGSGIPDDDFTQAVQSGIDVIHINTEIRMAYRKGIEAALTADPAEVAPAKYLGKGKDVMKEVVRARMKLFARM
jgi:fructose-bisphosphate aldolase, class II